LPILDTDDVVSYLWRNFWNWFNCSRDYPKNSNNHTIFLLYNINIDSSFKLLTYESYSVLETNSFYLILYLANKYSHYLVPFITHNIFLKIFKNNCNLITSNLPTYGHKCFQKNKSNNKDQFTWILPTIHNLVQRNSLHNFLCFSFKYLYKYQT